ncbi:hypothetical protein HOD05_05410 [Candidatus Woesearchaeota archaeon]|jgi:lysophospholipase L1-like esterase|nr:hypothetical protein [Candidatus Woesearchaeota archaeon]MBT4150512.1 hypothetical protein [Candidatus Woesearchaeota archaeon]MBT4247152.1 hypothetical protein [Candidatus Woesearchaeota archaeon]MBT4434622.1 hypothetical protein [Candidatus Woesearchaeota archaeon]MBT7332526.1 hypothetical protein [Candidatus Woesearchaeota archaeon]
MRFNQLSLIGVMLLVLFSFSIMGAEELNSCDNANSNTFCHHKLNIFYKAGTASYTGAKMLSSGKLEVNGGTFLWTWGDMADDEIAKSLVTVEQWKWAQSSYCGKSNACTKENFDAKKTFPPGGPAVAATPSSGKLDCEYKKIAIIGASNTVKANWRKSFGEFIQDSCDTEVKIFAKGSCGPNCQYNTFLQNALDFNPDFIIVNPSGNGISNLDSYTNNVRKIVKRIQGHSKKIPVGIMEISARKNYNYGGSAKWSQKIQDNVEEFNNNLNKNLNKDITSIHDHLTIDVVIKTYNLLDGNDGDAICNYCTSDGGHWTEKGHQLVADHILKEVFIAAPSSVVSPKTPSSQKGAGTKVSAGGKTFSSATFQGTDSERELDEVWNRISGFVGTHSGDVFYQNKWQPYLIVYGSGIPSSGSSSVPPVASPSVTPSLNSGFLKCTGADLSKLSSSSLNRCGNHLDLYKKHAKTILGVDDTETILTLMALTQQESSCRTDVNGGLMQVDAVCRPVSNCPTADKQIEEGIKVYKSSFDGLSKATSEDRIKLVLFSYNRGLNTAKKALNYRGQGLSLHDAMIKACRENFNKDCKGTQASCKYDKNGNDKCDFPGYGAQYHTKVQSRFDKACAELGGASGMVSSSTLNIKKDFLGQLKGGSNTRLAYDFFVLHDGAGTSTPNCKKAITSVIKNWKSRSDGLEISSHYYICHDGTTYQLLDEEKYGIHAGRSNCPAGLCPIKNVNRRSVGIDFQNYQGSSKKGMYTDAQYAAAKSLLKDIGSRRNIPVDDQHVLAHFEVTKSDPTKKPSFFKNDPYPGFDWSKIGMIYDHHNVNGPWQPAVVKDVNLVS